MIALVAHKFLLDVTHDAMQFHRIRTQNSSSLTSSSSSSTLGTTTANTGATNEDTKTVLTMEDLAASLREYGVNTCKPEYFSEIAAGTKKFK
jgi:transcription initiation factor TFIID subunit 10